MGSISRLTKKLPTLLQRIAYAIIPFRYRYDKSFGEMRDFLDKSQWWSEKELRKYQWQLLTKLLKHAYDNVPYYRRVFDSLNLKPKDIKTPKDLKKLPILTKATIDSNAQDLIAQNYHSDDLVKFSTSGSTGIKRTFYSQRSIYAFEAAFVDRAVSSHGPSLYGGKSIWLRRYVPGKGDPLWKEDLELSRMYFSAYHLSLKNLPLYIREMDNYGAKLLMGYPSSVYVLALLLEKTGLRLKNITTIHVTSEKMLDSWKEKIDKVFGIPVIDHYGMIEKVSFLHRCALSNKYHESLEYGYTELINMKNGIGDIVGTSLWNYAMPLIRYRMADKGKYNYKNQKCACGMGLPLTLTSIEGRSDDFLITPDGTYLPGVNFYITIRKIQGINMFKMTQDKIDHVDMMIVVNSDFNKNSLNQLREKMHERMGDKLKLEIHKVKEIPRDRKTGKIRCIENLVIREKNEKN